MSRRISAHEYEKIYQPSLVKLRNSLQEWNKKASAANPPYKNEVERLTQMLDWFQQRFSGGVTDVTETTSVETDRLLRAAALLSVYLKEREIAEGRAQGYPARVIGAIEADLSWMHEKADLLKDVEPDDVLWTVIPKPEAKTKAPNYKSIEVETVWDVFISHATEDKEPFVRQLAESLRGASLKVWYDQFTLKVGDSLRRSIDLGLARSKFGIVVLSPYFLAKEWPQRELDGLVAREIAGRKVILPVWHNIDANEICKFSPPLADRVAVKSSEGIQRVVEELLRAIAG